MNDLISRQDVINAVLVSNFSACTVYGRSEEGMATANELIQAIKNLPSAQPEQRWIPVSERLPEAEESDAWMFGETTYYLVTEEQGWMYLAKYIKRHDGRCEWDDDDGYIYSKNVTAWMPLPEPYKEEE